MEIFVNQLRREGDVLIRVLCTNYELDKQALVFIAPTK